MEEITFNSNCELCNRKDTPCRYHHLIPQRLIKILPKGKAKHWEHSKIRICNSCNNHIHPENKLYRQIEELKKQLGYKIEEKQNDVCSL